MKKPTTPLSVDLRYGGYQVLPIIKVFESLGTNVVRPGDLPFRVGLAEPLESWALYAFSEMGALTPSVWQSSLLYHIDKRDRIPRSGHFVARLNKARASNLIERVLTNAEKANADPYSDFIFDMIGVFGSTIRGAEAPGDVDIVFVARDCDTGELIPESDYYPFGPDSPTDRAARVLRGGTRRSDLSCHDLREINSIGAPYRVLWTREEGRVERPITQNTTPVQEQSLHDHDSIVRTDERCEAFRRKCAQSALLVPPTNPHIPEGTEPMRIEDWAKTVSRDALIALLAQHLCLPPSPLKDQAGGLIADLRKDHAAEVERAAKQLFPFLAASLKFGTWKWDPAQGLIKGNPTNAPLSTFGRAAPRNHCR